MPVLIPDETPRSGGLTEHEALAEIACRLFAAGKLALRPAAKLAGMNRQEFEVALTEPEIPVYRPTVQAIAHDAAASDRLRGRR